MDFYQIMVLIAVIAFVVLVMYAVVTLRQVGRTAESLEYLATITAENMAKTQSTFDLIDNVSSLLDSTFYKLLRLGVNAVSRYRSGKGNK